ncbi:MAG: DUF3025 domain-containing protein [Dechloromonas sp.]|nr:DUF3025 domain-containing protein [Dechloromonas sp.]
MFELSGASPLCWPVQRWLPPGAAMPDAAALSALAAGQGCEVAPGLPLRFVPPQADGLDYEQRIWTRGEVETRPDNWHDLYNALVWLSFPASKRALSAGHAAARLPEGGARGAARDALCHFDECGVLVLSDRPELLALLQGFSWRALFVEARAEVRAHMRFVIFGHALYDALRAPFRGLTGKALLYPVDSEVLAGSAEALTAAVDALLAADLAAGKLRRARDLQPLPLLGVPGVTPDSEAPAYYDDVWQFRPGRRRV